MGCVHCWVCGCCEACRSGVVPLVHWSILLFWGSCLSFFGQPYQSTAAFKLVVWFCTSAIDSWLEDWWTFRLVYFSIWQCYSRLERSEGEVLSKLVKLCNFWAISFSIGLSAFLFWCIMLLLAKKCLDFDYSILIANDQFWCARKHVGVGVGCLKVFVCWYFFQCVEGADLPCCMGKTFRGRGSIPLGKLSF